MNKDFVASVSTSSSLTSATINTLDFTSFTTDQQQQWRSSTPRSTAALPQNQHSFTQDFQLFASPETLHRVSPTASRAQAISSTAPNSHRFSQARHLSLSSRVSPIQSCQSPSLGHFHSSINHRSFSSPALPNQQRLQKQSLRQLAHLHTLPPVPPFDSTPSVTRRNNSAPTVPQGTNHQHFIHRPKPLTFVPGSMASVFDITFLPGSDLLASQDDFLDFGTNFQPTNYTPVSDMTPNDGTISPSELFKDDSIIMSAPPSTAFPNLSTPDSGYLESPAMASSGLNTSPLEDGLLDSQLNFAELDSMAPLFPQDGFDQFAQPPMPGPIKPSFGASASMSSASASPMVRQKSSPGRPPSIPFTHGRKHSDTCGISKSSSKSRSKVLPEIKIDSDDDRETAKRKKNTAAARKSRQRKQEAAEAAEAEIQRLRAIIFRLGGDPDAGV